MKDFIFIIITLCIVAFIVYKIEIEEKKEIDEEIDNPYYKKPIHRTIKTTKHKLKKL